MEGCPCRHPQLCADRRRPRCTTWRFSIIGPSNVAGERDRLPEGVIAGAKTESLGYGINDYGNPHYDGPNPPHGDGAHRYHFRLMALYVEAINLGPKAVADEVREEARKHLLSEAELIGTHAH